MAGLFLEIDAPVLSLMIASFSCMKPRRCGM